MKIKFALALSISSIMGFQAGEAARVNCPTYKSVVQSEKIENKGNYNKYSYEVQTTGDEKILLSGSRNNKPKPDVSYNVTAFKTENTGGCRYLAKADGHGWYDIMLLPEEKTAFEKCKPISVPGGDDYFDCN